MSAPPIPVRALLVGERLDLKAIEPSRLLAALPVVVRAGEGGHAVLFRYGAVVLFGLNPVEEAAFLRQLRPLVHRPYERPETEETVLHVEPEQEERVGSHGITVREATLERFQVVADALAKSVVLDHYEGRVSRVFEAIEPLATRLQERGRGVYPDRELLRYIGGTLLVQQTMVGRVEVAEKPEILWERPELERLYLRLAEEYELRERHRALERKLEVISRTAQTLLDLVQHRRSLRVEWYIVLLILVEILLSLYSLYALGLAH